MTLAALGALVQQGFVQETAQNYRFYHDKVRLVVYDNLDTEEQTRLHRQAAQAIDAILLPVGEAWLRALSKDKRLKLYGDAIHPSSIGSDLIVLTIYFGLFPAGPQEFTEAYVTKIAKALDMQEDKRDLFFDAATRAIDEPLEFKE